MPVPRRLFSGLTALLVLAVLGAGIYLRSQSGEDDDGEADDEARPEVAAVSAFADVFIPVVGVPAVRDTLVVSVTAQGQAVAVRQTVLTAHVPGQLQDLPVREGGRVNPGQLLAAIDPTEYELSLAEAQARVRQAEAQFRELMVHEHMVVDEAVRREREELMRLRAGLEVAEVALKRAEIQHARTQTTAPFTGRLANIRVVPGQWVNAGTELMTLSGLDPIRVETQVLQREVSLLEPGRTARVRFAAFPGEVFVGRVETINPVVEDVGTARVTVLLDNPDGRIMPGMFARVSLEAQHFPDRILVPREAILERDATAANRGTMLFVASDGIAEWRYVNLGLRNEEFVEIDHIPGRERSNELRPGEIVLVDGHYTLTHGARIQLVEDVRAAGGRPN